MPEERYDTNFGEEDKILWPEPIVVTPYYIHPDSAKPISIDNKSFIIDKESGTFYTITSKQYTLVRHQEIISKIEEIIASIKDKIYELPNVTTEFRNKKAKMERTYTFKGLRFPVAESDDVHPTLKIYNSYDRKWLLSLVVGAYRLISPNGMVAKREFWTHHKKHKSDVLNFDADDISKALMGVKEQAAEWSTWVKIQIQPENYAFALQKLELKSRDIEWIDNEIKQVVKTGQVEHPGGGPSEAGFKIEDTKLPDINKWLFYNILASYITGKVKNIEQRRSLNEKLRKTFYESSTPIISTTEYHGRLF